MLGSAKTYLNDAPDMLDKVQIGDITLTFRRQDGGGTHYRGRTHFEEYLSPFYALLKQYLNPIACIDIGANYGYTGLLMRRAFPDSRLTMVEPIPWLAGFIQHNFATNNATFDQLHSAIASEATESERSLFCVREKGSQDSRVVPQPGTTEIETDVVTLDGLTNDIAATDSVYIKIDTQGWEEHVFKGGMNFLTEHNRWFIKTEFAPAWLESQGSDPVALLRALIDRYDVYESTGRIAWNSTSLSEALGKPLCSGCETEIVTYIRNLGLNDTGWVDLYVLPPKARRGYDLSAQTSFRESSMKLLSRLVNSSRS